MNSGAPADPEPNRLIMVTGSGPGAGKSSLASALRDTLAASGVPTRLLGEDTLLRLEPFARFDREIGRSDRAAIHTLLKGVRELVAEWNGGECIWVTDALLPAWFWLLGRYPRERVEAFRDDLAETLRPLQPLIVYLRGDARAFFARAVEERGEEWRERFVEAVERWEVPLYAGGPVQGEEHVLRFIAWLDEGSRQLLSRWPEGSLMLNARHRSVGDLVEPIVRRARAPRL